MNTNVKFCATWNVVQKNVKSYLKADEEKSSSAFINDANCSAKDGYYIAMKNVLPPMAHPAFAYGVVLIRWNSSRLSDLLFLLR